MYMYTCDICTCTCILVIYNVCIYMYTCNYTCDICTCTCILVIYVHVHVYLLYMYMYMYMYTCDICTCTCIFVIHHTCSFSLCIVCFRRLKQDREQLMLLLHLSLIQVMIIHLLKVHVHGHVLSLLKSCIVFTCVL